MTEFSNKKISKYWPTPKRRSLSASSDLRLFYEAIEFINKFELVSKKQIKQELSARVKGLKLIKNISDTGIENLIRELKAFGWIYADRPGIIERSDLGMFKLTNEGKKVLEIYKYNKREFLNKLITKMHVEYVIPGWFIDRLWKLNPEGQGQVIIPTPLKSWNPKSKLLEDSKWNDEYAIQVLKSYDTINRISPNSFCVDKNTWVNSVKEAWERLSSLKNKKEITHQKFAPRNRLSISMKEAAVGLIFNNKIFGSDKKDFNTTKTPIAPRTYMAWCPRLEELELIFYTDFNPLIPGRILFPVCVFKPFDTLVDGYEFIDKVKNQNGDYLALHRPKWEDFRKIFMVNLYTIYQGIYLRNKSLYVSIQNLRDEVCRQLRLSSSSFEDFLSRLIKESIDNKVSSLTISIETDIREDQRQGYQLERRPVRINGKFASLIAITKQKRDN